MVDNGFAYAKLNPLTYIDNDGHVPARPKYNPPPWNLPLPVHSNNCWSYACNKRYPSPPPGCPPPGVPPGASFKPQPGGGAGVGGGFFPGSSADVCDCRKVMDAIKHSAVGWKLRRGRHCPKGTHTVILFVQTIGGCDFHFIRLDDNCLWSEKRGALPVGPQFPDPYKHAHDVGYNIVCAVYCVPN